MLRHVLHLVGALASIVAVLLIVLFWRLHQGPVVVTGLLNTLDEFIGETRTYNNMFRYSIGELRFEWSETEQKLDLVVDNLLIHDLNDEELLNVNGVYIDLALLPLLTLDFRPQSLTLVNPQISITRDESGKISERTLDSLQRVVASAGTPGSDAEVDPVQGFKALLQLLESPPLDRLKSLQIVNAEVWIDDRYLSLTWQAPVADAVFNRNDDGAVFATNLVIESEHRTVDLTLQAQFHDQTELFSVSGRINDLSTGTVADLVPELSDLYGVELALDLAYDAEFDNNLDLVYGNFSASTDGGVIDLPRFFSDRFRIDATTLEGAVLPGFSGIVLSGLNIGLPSGEVSLSGTLSGFENDSIFSIGLDASSVPVDDLHDYWPVIAGPNVRTWIRGRLAGGMLNRGTLRYQSELVELGDEARDEYELFVDLDVSETRLKYADSLPPVEELDARLLIRDGRLLVESKSGAFDGITVRDGRITMDAVYGSMGLVVVDLEGQVSDALGLAKYFPSTRESGVDGIDDSIQGSVEGKLTVSLPPVKDLVADDITYRFDGKVTDTSVAQELTGYAIEQISGTVAFDTRQVIAFDGVSTINGVGTSTQFRQSLREALEPVRSFNLRGTLDDDDRTALGIPLASGIEGNVDASVAMEESADGTRTWQIDLDLEAAQLDIALAGITKNAGELGSASARIVETPTMLTISDATLSTQAGGFVGAAEVQVEDLQFRHVQIDSFTFGRNDFAASVRRDDDESIDISITGRQLDSATWLNDDGDGADTLPALRISGFVETFWYENEDALYNTYFEGNYRDDTWDDVRVAANTSDKNTLKFELRQSEPFIREFEFHGDDAGDVIALFSGFDRIEGGTIHVHGTVDDSTESSVIEGTLSGKNFTVHETPTLVRLLSLSSLVAILQMLTNPEGMTFSTAELPFHFADGTLTLTDGRLVAPGVGFTVKGTADLRTENLALSGTVIPVYVLNSILDGIPGIGDIITGLDEGSGILAFSFEMQGPFDDIAIFVNPASILVPGIFRDILSELLP